MKYSLYLGRISGIKIFIHWTFLLLILWIVFGNLRSGLNAGEITWSVIFVLAIFGCVIFHELGHSVAAKRFNIKTKDITILPIGGVAQLESIPEKPKEELVVALAGPAVNFIIVAALLPFVWRSMSANPEEISLAVTGPENFLPSLVRVNLWLALFNLIPAFPMDGGRVLRALLGFRLSHARATSIAASLGQILAIIFVVIGFIGNPFLIFIGFFIFLGAQGEVVYSRSKFMLQGYTVSNVLMREIPSIDAFASLREAASRLLDTQNRNFLVTQEGKPLATISRDDIIRGLAESNDTVNIQSLSDKDLVILRPETPLEEAWHSMQQKKKPLMLVMQDDNLVGVVDEENISEFILIRTAESKRSSPSA